MLFSIASSRLFLRNASINPVFATSFVRRALPVSSTRAFSVTRAIMEPATKKTTKTASKTATKTKSKAAAKPKKSKKDADGTKKPVKKKEEVKKIRIRAEDKPPKRPPSAYAVFYGQYVAKIMASNTPDTKVNVIETTREAAKIWKDMPEDEKKVYQDESLELRAAYEKKRNEYFRDINPAILREINKRRVAKGLPRIKNRDVTRPIPAFFIFASDERSNSPPSPGQESIEYTRTITKDAAVKWRAMTDAEKQPYVDRAITINAQRSAAASPAKEEI